MAAVSRAPEFGVLSAKAEGLGLGGIVMPIELGGSPPAAEPLVVESRYQALKTYSRHSPSLSSPPSLAPFASAVKVAPSQPPSNPAPTPVNSRKSSVLNLSGDIISYPMVSRIDIAPTYQPPPSVPAIPTTSKTSTPMTKEVSSGGRKPPKLRPPPIKLATSTHASFLSPLKAKFGKEPSPDREKAPKVADKETPKLKKNKAESRVEENKAAFAARFPDTVTKTADSAPPAAEDEDDEDTLNITLPPKPATAPVVSVSLPPPVPSALPLERSLSRPERVPVPALGSPFGPPDPASEALNPNRPGHRRGTSDKSPQVVQDAFARVAMLEGVAPPRPVTMFATNSTPAPTARRMSCISRGSPPLTPSRKGSFLDSEPPSLAQQRRSSRARSISSAAGLPKPDDAFFAPSVGGSAASAPMTAAGSRRPSAVPTSNEGVASVGISVQEGPAYREVGRAAFSAEDRLTVSLRSYHRPDELEVGWVCIPQVDDEGRAYTTYEIRLRPRSPRRGSGEKKSSAATIARPRTPSASNTHFSNYRISDPPRLSPAGSAPPPDTAGMYPPGSPRTGATRRAAAASHPQRDVPPPPRKYSARSEGSSFSSESSTTGPATPRRGGKMSIASLSNDIPPFDLDAVLSSSSASGKAAHAFPQSATSSSFDLDELPPLLPGGLPAGRRRMGRASSYAAVAEQYRQRQFSIDEEGILNGRAVSFSVGPGAVAQPPKSPKAHRFGCYIPPVTPNKEEFAEMAKEAKRRSLGVQLAASESAEPIPPLPSSAPPRMRKASVATGMNGIPPLPTGVASRGRKQSIAPPATVVIPPIPHSTVASGDRVSPVSGALNSPLQPSPLRATAAAPTTPNELQQTRDVCTPTAARFDNAVPIPSASSVATVTTPSRSSKPASYPFPATLSIPLPAHLPTSNRVSTASTTPPSPPPPAPVRGLLFKPDASPAPSCCATESSFGNDLDKDHDPLAHDLTISIADVENIGELDSEEEEDLDVLEAKLMHARQAKRLASKWSDTEDDETEPEAEGQGLQSTKRERRGRMDSEAQAGTTSWCNIPDAEESD
ncbi:hypothetical protein JCM11251_001803 [Rhodosporidiobolus azoricus]